MSMALLNGPQLSINYAPELDLSLTCVRVQKYEVASPEYRFEVNCRIRHLTGHLEYFAKDLCFEPDGFARFAEELHSIQRGAADSAALKSVGEMLVFQLDRRRRKLSLRLSIREVFASRQTGQPHHGYRSGLRPSYKQAWSKS